MIYEKIFNVVSRTWWLGKIEDHKALPLTLEELDEVIKLLAENKMYKTIFEDAFSIVLNANDFFGYACADAVQIDCGRGFNALKRLVKEYGSDGLNAAISVAKGAEPIEPWQTEKFKKAVASVTEEERKALHEEEIASEWPELHAKVKLTQEQNEKLKDRVSVLENAVRWAKVNYPTLSDRVTSKEIQEYEDDLLKIAGMEYKNEPVKP